MKKAIVTGATGFVGLNLCKALILDGWKVSIIVRENSSLNNMSDFVNDINIYTYNYDIFSLIDYFKSENPDVVFHLASLFIAEHTTSDVDNLIDSNLKLGIHILEAMKVSRVKCLINTGTSWQHYNSEIYSPVDFYAATKQGFETIAQYYVEAENLKIITLKLFDTYGPNDSRKKLFNLLLDNIESGNRLELSPGNQEINLVYIDDVVNAYVLAGEQIQKMESNYEEYGVGTEEIFTLRELIDIFEHLFQTKLDILFGAKNYRNREVMKLWANYRTLPGWKPKTTLVDGIIKVRDSRRKVI